MDREALIQELMSGSLTAGDAGAPLILPRYDGLSIGNLPATIAGCFGVTPPPGVLPPLRADVLNGLGAGVQRIVLVLVDGLGWLRLQALLAEKTTLALARLAQNGRLVPLTSLFPSTTNNVLTTLWTGAPPARHGLIAFNLYLREFGMAVEAVSFAPYFRSFSGDLDRWGLIDEHFVPVPALAQWLAAGGVATEVVIADKLVGSGLSRLNFRGVRRVYGHATASDFWLGLRRALERGRGERLLVYGYWSALDSLAHRFGPWDDTSHAELGALDAMLESIFLRGLSREARAGTLLLVTADHGQVTTPFEQALILEHHPDLRDALLLPPLGESRTPFLYARAGKARWVREVMQTQFAERFALYSRSEVVQQGLLGPGPLHPEVPFRLGDWIGISRGGWYMAATEQDARRLTGRHGGLLPEEMLVPLLAVRLDEG